MKLRFDTLRVKLFLAIAGANVVLVAAAYLIYGWSFEQGLGDYLPRYAGNLDIMTAAGARTAEMFAEEILAGRLKLESNRATMVA